MKSYFNQAPAISAFELSSAILISILAALLGFPRLTNSKRELGAR